MLRNILLLLFVSFSIAEKVTFNDYRVFRIIPASNEQLNTLKQLEIHNAYDFWSKPSRVFQPIDLMVAPDQVDQFTELMNSTDTRYEVFIKNVQSLIDQENPKAITRENSFSHTRYHTLDEIYSWLDSLAQQYPGKVEVVVGGKSYEGREIKGVKLSFGEDKPGVFIEGGMHAREWISPATVTYLLDQFLTSQDSEVRKLAEAYDWYMFPSFNPDGYVYTHVTNRMWRKTLSKHSSECKGADGNRNWDFKWMAAGSSNDPCSESYAGKSAFSEIETRTMSEYIKSIGDKLFAYIDFHSYLQLLMFPYGHTTDHLDNYDQELSMGLKGIEALAKRYGSKYVTGTIAETVYPASGGSIDWVKANLKLPVTFAYELRDQGKNGFILPANEIIPNGKEVIDSLIAIFEEASKFGYDKLNAHKNNPTRV